MQPIHLILAFVGLCLLGFWMRQLVDLMSRSDDSFPGRYDKPIWAAILLTTSILGAFIYCVTKPGSSSTDERHSEQSSKKSPAGPQACAECGKVIPSDAMTCPSCGAAR